MSSSLDKAVIHVIDILDDNDNKLIIIKLLQKCLVSIKVINTSDETHSIVKSIEDVILSIEKSHKLVLHAIPKVKRGATAWEENLMFSKIEKDLLLLLMLFYRIFSRLDFPPFIFLANIKFYYLLYKIK